MNISIKKGIHMGIFDYEIEKPQSVKEICKEFGIELGAEEMDIIKAQLKNKHTAIKLAAELSKANVKCIRFGSAVVYLSTMQNNTFITDAVVANKGHCVDASIKDKSKLLEAL